MLRGSPCLLGAPCTPRCWDPICSGDTSPAFGLCLPSRHQGALWLLGDPHEGHGHAWSCAPGACTVSRHPGTCCVPGRPAPTRGVACGARGTPSSGPGPGPRPARRSGRRPGPCAPAAWGSLVGPPQPLRLHTAQVCVPPPPPCRPGGSGCRRRGNPGSVPRGLAPSCCTASGCQARSCVWRDCACPRLRPQSCPPLSWASRNLRPLCHLPGTFLPLSHPPRTFRPL
ncbi:unnamed protein product, partial [Pipistrellus nathusii]